MARLRKLLFLGLMMSASALDACSCEDPIFLQDTPGTCEPDFLCPPADDGTPFVYRQGECRVERCASDLDCCPGQKCNVALGFCGSELTACTEDADCIAVPDQRCIEFKNERFCGYPNRDNFLSEAQTQGCATNTDCDEGRTCMGSRCVVFAPCDGGCGPDEVCEIDSNSCFPLPVDDSGNTTAACDLSCDEGEMLLLADPDTMATAACCALECICATLPPVTPGQYGWHADITALTNEVAVSAYDAVYGDVLVAYFDDSGSQTRVEYVDGFPTEGALQGDPNGPRNGRFGPGPDRGEYTSITVDPTGVLHVAYYDREAGQLRYAHNMNGTWTPSVVDAEGHVGRYTSIAIDADGNPTIAYMMVEGTVDPDPMPRVGVKYATARTGLPSGPQDWTTQVVDSVPRPEPLCNGGCESSAACVDLGIGPTCETTIAGCESCEAGQACVAGAEAVPTCAGEINVSMLDGLIEGTGLFADLTVTATGTPIIVYYDSIDGNLRMAVGMPDDTFFVRTLDGDDPLAPSDVGQHASVAVGPDGTLAVAYFDATRDDLVYLDVTRNQRQIVDDGVSPPDLRQVGADADLVFDAAGEPAVAYQDPTRIDLLYARRTGNPSMWSQQVLRGDPAAGTNEGSAAGFFACQATRNDQAFIGSVDVSFDEDSNLRLELKVETQPLD